MIIIYLIGVVINLTIMLLLLINNRKDTGYIEIEYILMLFGISLLSLEFLIIYIFFLLFQPEFWKWLEKYLNKKIF